MISKSADLAQRTFRTGRQGSRTDEQIAGSAADETGTRRRVIPVPRSIRQVIRECRLADSGEQRIVDGLQDFLTKRRHGERGIAPQVASGLQEGFQSVDLLDEPCLTAHPQALIVPNIEQC